jgi:arylsulfatase A-like enzyme
MHALINNFREVAKMKLFHTCLVLLGITLSAAPAVAQDKRPNVVFLFADDAGYGDFGFTGHPYARTPAIDRLAKQSAFFKNFYVGGATCSPSRTALMTGRFPASFRKHPAQYGFGDVPTVTQLLRAAGYRIGHFGKWHLGETESPGAYGIHDLKVLGGNHTDPRGRDAVIADSTIEFLRANKDRPFYVNVWFRTPHNPVDPPQQFVDRFKEVRVNPADFQGPHMERYLTELKKSGEDIDLNIKKRLGDLSQLDDQVARILRVLDELGLSENTIVVFSSDNGPNPYGFAGILRGRKHNLYEGGVRLPLLVRWPGRVEAGRVDATSVLAGVDWLPTLCAIAGAKYDAKDLVGEDVSDIWLGKERSRTRDLFWRTPNPKATAVMRRGDWKLHLIRKGAPELYDLATDPSELKNVAAEHPAVVRELSAALNRWTAALPQDYVGVDKEKKAKKKKRMK